MKLPSGGRGILAALLAAGLVSGAHAGSGYRGTASGQFLKLAVGARAAAMGEAYSAIADEASAVYWNPAALTRLERRSATFMHADLIDSVNLEYLAYGQRLGEGGALGAGIQYLNTGGIQRTDTAGFETGSSINPSDLALSLSYARRASLGALGLTVKYIDSKLEHTASAWAVDLGALSEPYGPKKARLSLGVQNWGGKLRFDEKPEALPLNLRAGASVEAADFWRLSLDLNRPNDNEPFLAAGTEVNLIQGRVSLSGRAGFNTRASRDLGALAGISSGIGIGLGGLSVDYALAHFGDLGYTHRVSLTFRF